MFIIHLLKQWALLIILDIFLNFRLSLVNCSLLIKQRAGVLKSFVNTFFLLIILNSLSSLFLLLPHPVLVILIHDLLDLRDGFLGGVVSDALSLQNILQSFDNLVECIQSLLSFSLLIKYDLS
jgi:hypothetical protein